MNLTICKGLFFKKNNIPFAFGRIVRLEMLQNEVKYRISLVSKSLPIKLRYFATRCVLARKKRCYVFRCAGLSRSSSRIFWSEPSDWIPWSGIRLRKTPCQANFSFHCPPVPLDQFDGDRKQLHHIGHVGFYTVAYQPCTTLGIRMDILVRDLLQIRVRQTCKAHEQEHVTDSPLALVIQLDMDDALQVLLGEERTPLVFGQAVETDERMKPYPASFLGGIHQPFQGVAPAESR